MAVIVKFCDYDNQCYNCIQGGDHPLNEQFIIEPQVEDLLRSQLDFEDIIAEILH